MTTKKQAQTDSYEVPVVCDNCDHEGVISLPKGTPVSSKMLCPNCGCDKARKKPKLVISDATDYKPLPRSPFPDPWPRPGPRPQWMQRAMQLGLELPPTSDYNHEENSFTQMLQRHQSSGDNND